jgi:hypothetical protein
LKEAAKKAEELKKAADEAAKKQTEQTVNPELTNGGS